MSGGIGRSTASAGEQNVHGIDEQSIRSVASARGHQVRGVGKQVGAVKLGVYGVSWQGSGPSAALASSRKDQGAIK